MQPYLYVFLFSLLSTFLSFVYKKADMYLSVTLLITLILFIGLRYDSVDYFSYWSIYDSVKEFGLSGFSKENGFALLNLIEQKTTGHFFYFIFFFSLLSLWVKYSALKRMVPFVTLSLFLYVSSALFWKDLGQIRNGFVAGLMLHALYFAYNKKPIKFAFVILVASQIHMVAIIGAPIYFANRLKSKKIMLTILLGSFLVAVLGGLGHIIVSGIPADKLGQLSSRASSYVGSNYDTTKNILGIASLSSIFLTVFFIYHYDRLVTVSKFSAYIIPVAVIGLSSAFLLSDFLILGGRVQDVFYTPYLIVLLSLMPLIVKKSQRPLIFAAIIIYGVASFGYSYLNAAMPYQSIIKNSLIVR